MCFSEVYCLPAEEIVLDADANAYIEKETENFGSWQWLYGTKLPFSCSCEDHFPWGHIRLELQVESGKIRQAAVYSDAMDWQLPEIIEKMLVDCSFTKEAVTAALANTHPDSDICADILQMLQNHELL